MLEIKQSSQFRIDTKKLKTDIKTNEELKKVVIFLVASKKLPEKYRDNKLSGNRKNYSECHLHPDELLIYQVSQEALVLLRIGLHSQLFD